MQTILITGANGFLGKHVVNKLLNYLPKKNILTPTSKELNLLDESSVHSFFYHHKPNKILHMAAVCGGILANKNSPADFVHLNNKMTCNIFDAVYKYDVNYLYSLGSVCAYPLHCPVPFKEDDIFNGEPESTNAPYGQSKRLLFVTHRAYMEQYGLKGAHLIPVNMYGPQDSFDLTNSHVIPALIRKFCYAVDNGLEQVECWGTGSATREFLYAGDAADAIVKAVIDDFNSPLPVNLGTGKSVSIRDLAHLISKLVDYPGNVVFTGEVSDGQPKRQLDVSRAKELLNWEANTGLEEGLIKTIEWYRRNK